MIVSIQYLRAIAALLVVVFHYTNTFGETFARGVFSFDVGAFGVDVFFVISGYIMYTISALRPRTPLVFLKDRVLRIAPLYWLLTIVAAFVSTTAGFTVGLDVSPELLLKSLFFIPAWNETYPELVSPILLVGWTLNLEMVFYVVFAASLFFMRGVGMCLVLLILVVMGTSRLWLGPDLGPAASLYSETIVLEFAAGILIGLLFEQQFLSRWLAGNLNAARSIAALLLFCAVALLCIPAGYLGPRVVYWGVPASMLVIAALLLEVDLARTKVRFFELLGDASYSIYLVHLMAMPVVYSLIGRDLALSVPWLALVLQITCAVLIGLVTYFGVEQPLAHVVKGRHPFKRTPSVS